ncbi:hypothetical protein SAMN05661091_1900 [Paenibacillus uliginis N3/975]|uniref:Uncharacterized protein n=1 Tax=Paenibacillus uliginis N3/975 TaxID=1313296 RepID=A0A1X7H773_9BACL|nr:hypothetical protein SAMN05661091_1900 [Paenibacillus uliginis N3/975]
MNNESRNQQAQPDSNKLSGLNIVMKYFRGNG